jgi:hypothetical protein
MLLILVYVVEIWETHTRYKAVGTHYFKDAPGHCCNTTLTADNMPLVVKHFDYQLLSARKRLGRC